MLSHTCSLNHWNGEAAMILSQTPSLNLASVGPLCSLDCRDVSEPHEILFNCMCLVGTWGGGSK